MAAKGLWISSITISSVGLIVLLALPAVSQDTTQTAPAPASSTAPAPAKTAATPPKRETVAKPLTEKERKKKEAQLKKELETPWRKWLNEDVTYIITDEERKAFKGLNTDEERESFVEQFWLRRDPTPDTIENEYKEEHYRRIAYANEHFPSGIPGWKTDRGRIYITYGPPDEINAHPSGGSYDRPDAEGGGTTSTYPFEDWRYRYIEGIGNDINIEFVDTTMSGEYHMTMDPSEKDALLYVPGAGLTMAEQMGLSDKSQRFNNTDGTHLGAPIGGAGTAPVSYNEFERIGQFAKLQAPPVIKYKDLEAAITSRITYNILPMQVRVDYVRVTDSSVLANITIQFENKDLQFQAKDGVDKAQVELLGRISTMTRRPVTTFESPLEIVSPIDMLQKTSELRSIYQKSVPLAPNRYRLNIVAKDKTGGNMNNYEVALDVPHFDDEKLASSSLILADTIERLPTKSIGGIMFSIGDTKVRPRLGDKFTREEKLGIYLQVYNFTIDEKTKKPAGSIEYEIVKVGSTDKVLDFSEDIAKIPNASASQVTIEKLLPLKSLPPGTYTLKVKATDKGSSQTVQQQQNFTVS
jgi:GWxTD domain-containing protein